MKGIAYSLLLTGLSAGIALYIAACCNCPQINLAKKPAPTQTAPQK